jgi:hypothetical protein
MAKTKTATSSTPAMNDKVKKASKTVPRMSRAQRAAAVEKNIGKSQPLNEFLASIGWR